MRLFVATKNPGKLKEIKAALSGLSIEFESPLETDRFPEALENGKTFAENARIKAEHYFSLLRLPVLADDSGLEVRALGGAPGVRSARFAPTDRQRIQKLLEKLAHLDPETQLRERGARFVCALCFYREEDLIEVTGEIKGFIVGEPRGDEGFGYDPIFYYPPLKKTMAEMTLEEKNQISHRARALQRLRDALTTDR
ncbi:MAG: RdgB/HAM1 family non-canonical purine NTP pyrophosphatase [Acidobacteriota bacterium]